ncbi:unnamed protein product [Leptidea sinapis]|uniref:FLYWCH-type domain-containing protein n=1 Tax=Leptidea sinapis TaxID=189913 RepID=A0A5E4Q006_9NEOP|nr:unnamed protein product [Leptidea sinapis]
MEVFNSSFERLPSLCTKFVKSQRGKTLILYDGFTFCRAFHKTRMELAVKKKRHYGRKTHWACSTHHRKAKYVTSQRGKTLISYDGFTFCRTVKKTKMELAVKKYRWILSFVTSKRGNTLILCDGFTFYRNVKKAKIEITAISYTTSRRGKPMIICNGFTFYKHVQKTKTEAAINKFRWICSTHGNKGCRAFIITIGDEIVNIMNRHNHSKLSYITSRRGNTMILLDGFTFCRQVMKTKMELTVKKYRWCCSTHNNKGCSAFITTLRDEIINFNNNHNHSKRYNL